MYTPTHFAEADSPRAGGRGIDWQMQQFTAMAGEWRGPVGGEGDQRHGLKRLER